MKSIYNFITKYKKEILVILILIIISIYIYYFNKKNNYEYFNTSNLSWVSEGNPLVFPTDNYYYSLSINYDGTRIACIDNNRNACIYEYKNRDWQLISNEISDADLVALSSDGTRIAISYGSNVSDYYTKIYSINYDTKSIHQIGLRMSASNTQLVKIELNKNGTCIIMGYPYEGDGAILEGKEGDVSRRYITYYKGRSVIYEDINETWVKKGQTFNGDAVPGEIGDRLGTSVSINGDGDIIAISLAGVNNYKGNVKVYQYSRDSSIWTQLGTTIEVEGGSYAFQDIDLSDSGDTLAITSSKNTYVSIYKKYRAGEAFNHQNWKKLGQNIIEEKTSDDSEHVGVSLSADGNRFAIQGDFGTKIFEYNENISEYNNNSTWIQLGQTLTPGTSVGLSGDGMRIIITRLSNREFSNNRFVLAYVLPPIHCEGAFINVGSCSKSCGTGIQNQIYKITKESENYGNQCEYKDGDTEIIDCNTQPCPIDCEGSFGAFNSCSAECGGGTQSRTYTIQTNAEHGGATCPHINGDIDTQNCNTQNCPIDCVGSFGAFDTCDKNCGGGTQSKTYTIQTNAEHGGATCPHTNGYKATQNCNTQPCIPGDCVGSFGAFDTCNKDCGGGTKSRTYTIQTNAVHSGSTCPYTNGHIDTQNCNIQPCPIDCEGYFENFNTCSEDCGDNGFKLKKFIVEKQARYGGKQCTYYNKTTSQIETITDSQYVSEPCNRQPCTTYPHKLIIKNTLTEKDIELQKIRYNILDRQSKLNILTNNFNTINSNISDLKNNSNYIPDDNTLKFF
jgi:hypothetical protein